MSGLPDGTRMVVTGNPTAEEVAAVVVALDQVLAGEQAANQRPRRRGWQEAARREAVGGRVVRTRADLDTPLP